MDAKILLVFIGIINYSIGAGLLRTPKVYNAVITTDENLTPSRAFPVIQPTIHETGIATYPLGPFNPYRFYNPPIVHFGPPGFPQGLIAREQYPIPYPPPQSVEPESNPEQRMLSPEQEIQSSDQQPEQQDQEEQQQQQPQQQNSPSPNKQVQPTEEKTPIPLNEYGLPPSLIPVQSHPQPPILQPYTYNHYPPLIYEPNLKGYPDPYLPHYGYYPPHTFRILPFPNKIKNPTPPSAIEPNKSSSSTPQPLDDSSTKDNELNNIKNGITNKNSEVPDVPPPPLPSGTKSSK